MNEVALGWWVTVIAGGLLALGPSLAVAEMLLTAIGWSGFRHARSVVTGGAALLLRCFFWSATARTHSLKFACYAASDAGRAQRAVQIAEELLAWDPESAAAATARARLLR